jgi:membrane protein involved in colicin uptake
MAWGTPKDVWKRRRRQAAARKGWETRREREERVVVDLPPEHVALWERVKGQIKGETPHARAEALEQYAHDHPGEAWLALQDQADAEVERLVAMREAS